MPSQANEQPTAVLTAPATDRAATSIQPCKTDLIRQLRKLHVPGLAAAIIKDDQLIGAGAAGMADIEQARPVTPDTCFLVASVSKTITATALMQLYEQGELKLDDDINKYLPYAARIPAEPISPITFRQLLTHTASLKDNGIYFDCPGYSRYGLRFGSFITRGADSPISLADFTKGYLTPGGAYYDKRKNFKSRPPGTSDDYSNMGITLVGYLVEVISRTPFDQYCNEHIFKPLGMHTTSWRLAGMDPSTLAIPYDKSLRGYVPYGHYGEPSYPDGMLRTSVIELARFLMAYMEGGQYNLRRILKPTTVAEMLMSQTPLDLAQGLVWYRDQISRRWKRRTVWGHDGSDFGAGAKMWFDPARRTGVILMTNGVWKFKRARKLLARLFDEADEYS